MRYRKRLILFALKSLRYDFLKNWHAVCSITISEGQQTDCCLTYGASGMGWKPNQVEALQND